MLKRSFLRWLRSVRVYLSKSIGILKNDEDADRAAVRGAIGRT